MTLNVIIEFNRTKTTISINPHEHNEKSAQDETVCPSPFRLASFGLWKFLHHPQHKHISFGFEISTVTDSARVLVASLVLIITKNCFNFLSFHFWPILNYSTTCAWNIQFANLN